MALKKIALDINKQFGNESSKIRQSLNKVQQDIDYPFEIRSLKWNDTKKLNELNWGYITQNYTYLFIMFL